jgi:pimeloyl-ACP methyl ester carboxylesterase
MLLGAIGWAAAGVAVTSAGHAAPPSTRSVIEQSGVHVEVIAQGQGPLIVLLPSRGRGAEDFDDLASRLADAGYRVLRPQPRGIGASQGPLTDITLHDLARDVAAVIEREQAGPAVLAGHAFGNWVARTLATDRPALVRAVILLAAAGRAPIAADIREAIEKSGEPGLPEAERLGYLERAFFAPGHDARVWLGGWYPDAGAAQGGASRRTPQNEFIPAGRAPILDVQAAEDTVAPQRYAADLKNELGARVTTVVIPRAGHALLPEQPVAVADAIVTYLRAH